MKARLEKELAHLDGVSQALWNTIAAQPTSISEDFASRVGDAEDFEHRP